MCDQLPDNLILDGRDVAIEPLPMLENNSVCSVPEKTMPMTTGHYRGYVAYWELTPQGLYLNRLEGCYQLKSDSPVFADWILSGSRNLRGEFCHPYRKWKSVESLKLALLYYGEILRVARIRAHINKDGWFSSRVV